MTVNMLRCGGCDRWIPADRRPRECFSCGWTDSDPEAPYQRHSDTSKSAAEGIVSSSASLRARVLHEITASRDGLTDEELQTILDMNPSTERPRRVELVERALVKDSGRTRKTRSGRKAVVWVLAE